MTTTPCPVLLLLVELARRGIELRAAGDRLRYRPRSAMTPDLADRLTAHRGDLLAILAAADLAASDTAAPAPTYTPQERRLLDGCPAAALAPVDAAKRAFAPLGGVTVEAGVPFKNAARDGAARLIRDARRGGDYGQAVALRDAWRKRLAICTVDGDLSIRDAEAVAQSELQEMVGNPTTGWYSGNRTV